MRGTLDALPLKILFKGPKPRLPKRSRQRQARLSSWRRCLEHRGAEGGSNVDPYTELTEKVRRGVEGHRPRGTSVSIHGDGDGNGGSKTNKAFGCPPGNRR